MNAIKTEWLSGQGLPDTLVIDGHVHIGDWPQAATFRSVDEAVAGSQELMDAHGVDAVCAFPGYIFGYADYRLGNDFLLKVWRRLPECLIPFMGINANDSWEQIRQELDRMTGAGVHAIKLLNAYQGPYPDDGPNLLALYEYAAEHRLLVFNHGWSNEVILKISQQFPETNFIFGHYGAWQNAVLQSRGNVYANIWSYGPWGWLDFGVREVGAGKFMLGSDGFLNALSVGIGPVVFAEIPDDQKRQILGLTLARLLDRVGALPEALREKYQRFTVPGS